MPVSQERAREIAARMLRGATGEELLARLRPTPPEEVPLPPHVPAPRDWSEAARQERLRFFEEQGADLGALSALPPAFDPASLQGNIEHFVGMTAIPTGVIGPLRVNGLHAHGDYYVPLATSEGALVASYDRGARLISMAGGATCITINEQVQRAPGFAFASAVEAAHFAVWAVDQVDTFRTLVAGQTRHGRLVDLMTHVEANHVFLIFAFHTGDAAGQNMVTLCTAAVCAYIVEHAPVAPRHWYVEANMSGDKKATVLGFLHARGRHVTCDVVLPRRLVERGLRSTVDKMCAYWRMSFSGGMQSGSIGVSGHVANGLAALFLACGQDVACVSEASVGITRLEETDDGDLYASVTLPNLIVGTVGGGTRLPTAQACLRLLGCEGTGKAAALAEVCAATALAGELSIVGALTAGEFAASHARYGRPPAAAPEEAQP